ncbi:MAG TPA: hypothetical protein VGZ71_16950, partial [Puia sp.]|nr:hypothetical protein [Puia sp.]
LIRTHSYPSPSQCKKNGRANLKGKSVFYCSNRPLTSLAEARPEKGSNGYLSIWQANTSRDVKYGICLPAELRKENDFNFMAQGIHEFVKDNSLQTAGEKAAHFQFYFRFITERFISEECPYPLSSWIANEMLFGEHWKDFIIYPSVANKTYACNMAFHPNSADTLLKFEKVMKFTVDQFEFPQIRLSKVKIGEIVNSRMTWHKATDSEMEYIIPGTRKL